MPILQAVRRIDARAGGIQFDVEHCLSFILFNDDMLEDSIIPWLPFIRNELSKNVSRAIDDAVYNGDASTNQDGHTDTFHIRNACHGLRWMCGATADGWIDTGTPYNATPRDCNVSVVNGTLALSNIEQAIRQMGKYALQPAKCVYAVRVPDYLRLMQLDVFRLYTNAGPQQTLHNGVMGQIYGIDVVPTDIIPLFNGYGCLTAGAGADGSGGDIWGSSKIWRRDQALVGFYDTIQIESTRWAPRLMTIMQADVRFEFQTIVGQTQDNTSGWPYVNLVKTTAA